jgi:hypothetical protein
MLLTGAVQSRIPPHPLSWAQEISFYAYFVVGIIILLLPTWVALYRRRPGAGKIILANLFLSWTVIGWVLALIYAFRDPGRKVTEPYICRNCYTVSMPSFRPRQWFFGQGAWNSAKLYGALAPALNCPRCNAPNPVPLDTPAGQEIAARTGVSSSIS